MTVVDGGRPLKYAPLRREDRAGMDFRRAKPGRGGDDEERDGKDANGRTWGSSDRKGAWPRVAMCPGAMAWSLLLYSAYTAAIARSIRQ